ncbi:centrosomal protein of 78 kDa [Clinocottus analis]|uniref:centrosomal protein of 78 kDa n=1 Tax=Clinocottus analis TaxID=304258 RepID=UPI0035BF3F35
MVQAGAHIRRRDAQDFMACYEVACARQESAPLPAVKMNLDKGMLDFRGDRVKLPDWPPILSSICINKHLHHIAISSTYQAGLASGDTDRTYYKSGSRKRIPAIRSKDMTFKLCKALEECLTVSSNLKTLQLNGLPLRERDLITLTKGFSKSVSLENLSLANCPISDEGLEVICQSVKYSTSIRTVDFTGCNLTWRGAEHMANIIKHQGMQRHDTAWAESLRYRKPQFEGMGGLRRVTLNCNMLIGDRGAAALAHEVAEDLWVKALDLQKCGLSNDGARRLLEALKANTALCVLDIRSNPLIDKVLIKTILERVLMNTNGQPPEYCWIKPAASQPQKASCPKRRALPGSVRGKTKFRKAARKGTSPAGQHSGDAQTQKPFSSSGYVPWRAAARAGRQRGLPPGDCVMDQRFQGAATVKVTESDSEGEEDDKGDEKEEEEEVVVLEVSKGPPSPGLQDGVTRRKFEHMQMELKECRLRLAEERRARLKAESRLMEFELETARLRDHNLSLSEALAATGSASASPALGALEDEAVLESIESSFTKFHAFLDLLKDAGLGQLASMAGLDKSDLQPPGRPQLSSTVGPYSGGAASPTAGKHRADRATAGTSSSMRAGGVLPAPRGRPADTTPPRSPFSIREFLREGRLLDLTFDPTSGPTDAAGLNEEEEPDTYSKLESRRDSGSERSFRSQNSFDVAPLSKTFRTRSSRHRRYTSNSNNSNSHSSNGSHGHSYSSSYAHSHSSHGSGTHGGLIARLSVSDAMSDGAESSGSAGSRNRRKGRLAVSERNSCPGRDTLQQFRALGGQSEDESF